MTAGTIRIAQSAGTILVAFLLATGLAREAGAQSAEKLFFSSDIHDRQSDLFDNMWAQCGGPSGNTCELFGLVGDFNSGDPTVYDSDFGDISSISMGTYNRFGWQMNTYNWAYVQGNHDRYNTFFTGGNAPTGSVPLSNNDYYEVYRINYGDFDSACDGLQDRLDDIADEMLFVLSHYPLHSTRGGDQDESICMFDAMNDAGNAGKDITFVWGHNHRLDEYDDNVRLIATPGQQISMGSNPYHNANATKTLSFSCINAGYTKHDPTSAVMVYLYETWMAITRVGDAPDGAWVNR